MWYKIRRPDGSYGIYGVVDMPDYALVIARDGDRFCLVEQFRGESLIYVPFVHFEASVSLAALRVSKRVFHQAFGSRKLADEQELDGSPAAAEPMTEDTIFDIA